MLAARQKRVDALQPGRQRLTSCAAQSFKPRLDELETCLKPLERMHDDDLEAGV